MSRSFVLIAAVLSLSALPGCRPGNAADAQASSKTIPVTITSSGKMHRFSVEVARTEAEQARGLMFRTQIPVDGGMIFPMSPPRMASFWMKDCPVPEDMIFIRADGTIARIAQNTIPYSTDPISSGEPVAAVLELAGGRTSDLGISEGDRVDWSR